MNYPSKFLLMVLGSLLVAGMNPSRAEKISPSARARARVIAELDLRKGVPGLHGGGIVNPSKDGLPGELQTADDDSVLQVNPGNKGAWAPLEFEVPVHSPAFLDFEISAIHPGRLVLHLQATALPDKLAGNIPEKDWANPGRQHDFRSVVEFEPGEQRHILDLNRDWFEAISREKVPYDLASLKFKELGFEVVRTGEKENRVQIGGIKILVMTPVAMTANLNSKMKDLLSRLTLLPANPTLERHWKPRLHDLQTKVDRFQGKESTVEDWRKLEETMDEFLLASHKWSYGVKTSQPYVVGIESSLRRISGRHPSHIFRGRIEPEVVIDSARNEYENVQLVILPLTTDLDQVRLSCSDLRGESSGKVIPASNIAMYHQIEQWIQPSLRTPVQLVGWTPDVLLPITDPFRLGELETKPIWITIYTPTWIEPGSYAGQVTVQPSNAPSQTIRVKLRVHDFEIPQVGRFRTQGHFALEALQEWYGQKNSAEVRKAFYCLLLEHRFSPTSQYSRMLSPLQEDIPWVMRQGGNVILIGGYSDHSLEPEVIGPAYDWLVSHGYIDSAIIYIGDETDDFGGIRKKSETIRKQWPRLRIMVGGSKPRPELEGYVDVWDPITNGGSVYDFDPDSARSAQARGEEVFWYTCIGPHFPYANIQNDDPLTAIRALWWQAWKYGVTGFEYWWFNWWASNLDLSRGDKPWPQDQTSQWNSRSYTWANGDGLLVYPGPAGQPLGSLRFSVIRDAIEDWETLFLLQRAVELVVQHNRSDLRDTLERAQRLVRVPSEITSDLTRWSRDPEMYLRARREMYELLDALRAGLGPQVVDDFVKNWSARHQRWLQEKFEERVRQTVKN